MATENEELKLIVTLDAESARGFLFPSPLRQRVG
jgi:hypothetical protein